MLRDLLAFLLGWSAGWWLLWRIPLPPSVATTAPVRPAVSIVVPARDEEAVLPELLSSLGPELRPGDEVIVVDDRSTDTTADQARAAGVVVIFAPPLPPGWLGKPWACHLGAAAAGNGLLLFLDADTRLVPGGLDRLIAGHAASDGLYSVQPWHEVPRPHERLAAVFNVVAMMGTAAFTPRTRGFLGPRRRWPTGAFGPCLVTTAGDYRAAGGHAAVRYSVLDDLALARRYRSADLPVTIRGGRGTISFRMYPAGVGQLVEGFTKNYATAARSLGLPALVLVTAWLVALSAPVALVTGAPVLAAICYVAAAAQLHIHLRRIGSFGAVTAALYLVPLAFFLAVFTRSVVLTFVRRRVSWKGRAVPTRPEL